MFAGRTPALPAFDSLHWSKMKTLIVIAGCALFVLSAVDGTAQNKQKLTLEAIFGGSLSSPAPTELRWAPDGRRLSFLMPEEGEGRSLWILDISTGQKTQAISELQLQEMAPSPEQTSASERERTRRERYQIASYSWSPDGRRILLSSGGQLYLYDLSSRNAALLAGSKVGLGDPKFSPDGKWIAFVYRHEVWVVPSAGGEERRLTPGGGDLLLYGEPDWVYQEEFDVRTGYRWSPDSRRIVFVELDESPVPAYPLVDEIQLQSSVDLQRYPKAGDPNPKARVGVVDLQTGKTVWSDKTAEYIPRIDWADERAVVLQLLNRTQNELELVEIDSETGRSHSILIEQDSGWLDVGNDLRFLSGGRQFLWTSSRSGFNHIYLYDRNGKILRQLTKGEWMVYGIEGVDEPGGWIYYSSNQDSVLGRTLYRVKIDGTSTELITQGRGTHGINMSAQAVTLVDSFSSLTRQQEIIVRDLVSGKEMQLFRAHALDEFELAVPEMKLLKAPDGAAIRVLLYRSGKLEPGRKYPVLVYVYGMPGAPAIQDAWPGNRGLFHQFMVQQGFVVALIDDRSSAIPGHRYALSARCNIGPVAAKDHEIAVQYLKSLPYVDGNAVGIWGWSGGGFTVAYHMTHTNLFKAGVAAAPVTDWRLYDSVYTERYMGLPGEQSEAYERTSSVRAAADYAGRMLVIYGTQDDNVHPQNSIQLINSLIRNKKQFDLMVYPGKTHGINGAAESIHLYTMIKEFLERYLK